MIYMIASSLIHVLLILLSKTNTHAYYINITIIYADWYVYLQLIEDEASTVLAVADQHHIQ